MDTHTDALHIQSKEITDLPIAQSALLLAEGQIAAASVVRDAAPSIAKAAVALAQAIRVGGTIDYVAAGSSGLMAAADAQELGGTFSIPASQLRIHMAGGLPTGVEMPGDTEDETAGLAEALSGLSKDDCVIAVSASGSTPYTVAACDIAKAKGAVIVAIANNPGARLFDGADHPIVLPTPPEVLTGSTRMGAGTAQKIALNMMSTLMAVELGHIHEGMMVNLRVDNLKLRARAVGMIARIADVDTAAADAALESTNGAVKPAILVAAGQEPAAAEILLRETEGNLRVALARLA